MVLTKLQNLYRAAIAVDPSVAIDGLGILGKDWTISIGKSQYKVSIPDEHVKNLIAAELSLKYSDIHVNSDIHAALELIASKEKK